MSRLELIHASVFRGAHRFEGCSARVTIGGPQLTFGNIWRIANHKEDLTLEELESERRRRVRNQIPAKWLAGKPPGLAPYKSA